MLDLDVPADALVQQLVDYAADDWRLRERAARLLAQERRHAESVALLREKLSHFNAHEPGGLPCLCRRCMDVEEASAVAQGKDFTRDFTVAEGRVLFYWRPAELDQRAEVVRRSVNAGLRARLRTGDS